MRKAIFLDRDGVINIDTGYVYLKDDFLFMDGIYKFCRDIQSRGYLLIVITNQAGIARGYYSESDFQMLNNWMINQFSVQGIEIAKTYYCPYHPEYGIGKYKFDSPDRKPNPGMILKSRDEFDIDIPKSVLIGDKVDDMIAGHRAGIGQLMFLHGRYEPLEMDFSYDVCDSFDAIRARIR